MVWLLSQHCIVDPLSLLNLLQPHTAVTHELEAIDMVWVETNQLCKKLHCLRVSLSVVVDHSQVVESTAIFRVNGETLEQHFLGFINILFIKVDNS